MFHAVIGLLSLSFSKTASAADKAISSYRDNGAQRATGQSLPLMPLQNVFFVSKQKVWREECTIQEQQPADYDCAIKAWYKMLQTAKAWFFSMFSHAIQPRTYNGVLDDSSPDTGPWFAV